MKEDDTDTSWFIRPSSSNELEQLVSLARTAFGEFGDYRETIRHWVNRPEMTTLVAVARSEVVGFIVFGAHAGSKTIGHMIALAVVERYREQGVGRQLLNCALVAMAENGLISAELAVARSNQKAQALFRSLGFESDGQTVTYPNGEDGLVMSRRLPSGFELH